MSEENEKEHTSFSKRLANIERLETELVSKSSAIMKSESSLFLTDLYVMGAVKRILALAAGFRQHMEDRNFTCAAALLRMQIDTAARIYALRHIADLHDFGKRMIAGERFDRQKTRGGERLRDAFIIGELQKDYPWVKRVYEETSDFVHLSGRHFFSSIADLNDKERSFHIQLSATDPQRDEKDYFEILDAFFEATKLSGMVVLGYLSAKQKLHGNIS